MKYTALLFLFTLVTTQAFAQAQPSQVWDGCYKTTKWNGKVVVPPPNGLSDVSFTAIEEARYIADPVTHQKIGAFSFYTFREYANGKRYYGYDSLLLDRGTLVETRRSGGIAELDYQFYGKLYYIPTKQYFLFKYRFKASKNLNTGKVIIVSTSEQPDAGFPNLIKDQYELTEITCPNSN